MKDRYSLDNLAYSFIIFYDNNDLLPNEPFKKYTILDFSHQIVFATNDKNVFKVRLDLMGVYPDFEYMPKKNNSYREYFLRYKKV